MEIAGHPIGNRYPTFIIAEIGLNHNGDVAIAKRLIDAAKQSGADAVKFQKRNPDVSVPRAQWDVPKQMQDGSIVSYIEYKRRMEFGQDEYAELDAYCRQVGILWFASCWDMESVAFMRQFNPPAYKIASASLTNLDLLRYENEWAEAPVILSTGMSTLWDIDRAVDALFGNDLILLHCRSAYPAALDELNLNTIRTLQERYALPVGYSGHETGLATTVAAVAMGACVIERHITLDRASWGSDQSASVEPQGFARLVKDIRAVDMAKGDGITREYASEAPVRLKLRGA